MKQDKLNHICKKYGIKGVILQNRTFSFQYFYSLDSVIWFDKITKKSKKFVNKLIRHYSCKIIVGDKYITDGEFLEYYLEKLKHYNNKGVFNDWYIGNGVTFPKYVRNHYQDPKFINNEQGYAYASIKKDFLYHLKDNSYKCELTPYDDDFGTLVDTEFDGFRYGHFHVKILCNEIYDVEYGDCVTYEKLSQENVFIKKRTSSNFDYRDFEWISLKDVTKEDLDDAFVFDEYLCNKVWNNYKVLNLLRLYDGNVPKNIDENSDYVSYYASMNGYEEVEVPDEICIKLMSDVEFYDAQDDVNGYGFLSLHRGREVFFEHHKDAARISSKNVKVYRKDDKLVTFSFIDFNNCL